MLDVDLVTTPCVTVRLREMPEPRPSQFVSPRSLRQVCTVLVIGTLILVLYYGHLAVNKPLKPTCRNTLELLMSVSSHEHESLRTSTQTEKNQNGLHDEHHIKQVTQSSVSIESRMSVIANKTPVLVYDHPGQQGSGALCLSTLQCFLSSIYDQFYLIEPYLDESHLRGYSDSRPPLTFSSLFNFQSFNAESKKAGYTEMLSLNDFQREERVLHHKYMIFIHIRYRHNRGSVNRVAWTADSDGDEVNCFDFSKGSADFSKVAEPYRKDLKIAIVKLSSFMSKRCLVRVIELEITRGGSDGTGGSDGMMATTTVSSIFNFIFDRWSPQDVLLIFNIWPKTFIPVDKPLNGVNCLREYTTSQNILKSQFQVSERLIKDAEKYEKMFLGNENRLAIMFRVERVVTEYLKERNGRGKTLEGCFQEVLRLKKEIEMNSSLSAISPLVTLDIGGKYGTDSFKEKKLDRKIEELSKKTLEALYRNKSWSIPEWENSFVEATGGVVQGGYIAALQRVLASRADCMILMGGGDYQALAVSDYLDLHKNRDEPPCIHLVCVMSKVNDEVQETIKQHEA